MVLAEAVRDRIFEALEDVLMELAAETVPPGIIATMLMDVSASYRAGVLVHGESGVAQDNLLRAVKTYQAMLESYSLMYTDGDGPVCSGPYH
jgi:hypothetical protein